MKKWNGILISAAMILLFAACQKSANNSPYPQITFKYFTPDSVKAGSSEDTLYLAFDYTDGDGDLGKTQNGSSSIILIDSRDSAEIKYPFPYIESADAHDPKTGQSGMYVVQMQGAFLIPRQDSIHRNFGDTLTYSTYIIDEAGNESNRFTTPTLYIRP